MDHTSASTSYTVSSPRRTLSLLKKRKDMRASVSVWDVAEESSFPLSPTGLAGGLSGAKPSEVYGFVGAISTVIATVVFLAWAYTPESWLNWMGITYYPSKYWALAIPTYAMVALVLALTLYVAMNFLITPPPTSFNIIFDEYSREPVEYEASEEDVEMPIEPISDIGINHINTLMFGG